MDEREVQAARKRAKTAKEFKRGTSPMVDDLTDDVFALAAEVERLTAERDEARALAARLLEEVGQLNARWTTEMRQRYIEGLNVALSQLWGGGTKQDAIDAITKLIQAEQYKWVKEGGAK